MRVLLPVPLANMLIMAVLAPATAGKVMDLVGSVSVTSPFTAKAAPLGLFVLIPTPPEARMRNWLLPVEAKSASVESAQTNAPGLAALARRPAAKAKSAFAELFRPPGTTA